MSNVPPPTNEPVLSYAPSSAERAELKGALRTAAGERPEIPILFGGEHHRSDSRIEVRMPHDHNHVLATSFETTPAQVHQAIDAAMAARRAWSRTTFEDRASILLRAAELLAGPWRQRVNAACMLGQSKTCHQSEIDAVCELADFWRFNVAFAEKIQHEQPSSPRGLWNRVDYRPLEGFVFAVTPFNFLSIAANLPTAAILMGNVAIWKPASTSLLGCWSMIQLLEEAGLPPGVLSMLPGAGKAQGDAALSSPHLAGVHFTGSTATFQTLWRGVASNLDHYRTFPRLVGETGGKDFIVAHESADVRALITAISRGSFEYQGQKCSAASRIYVPKSLWGQVRDGVAADMKTMKFGDVADLSNFGGAVIDERAFDKISGYVELAKSSAKIVAGGTYDKRSGWFIDPALVEVDDPAHRLMQEEIFGPVATVYPYSETFSEVLTRVDHTSPYALTGAIFANDRAAAREAEDALRDAAGNFYINDKPTGAVVGQQPFGGARKSGTNDKAGMHLNLLRWVSPRSIKENFGPATDYRYPFLAEDGTGGG